MISLFFFFFFHFIFLELSIIAHGCAKLRAMIYDFSKLTKVTIAELFIMPVCV